MSLWSIECGIWLCVDKDTNVLSKYSNALLANLLHNSSGFLNAGICVTECVHCLLSSAFRVTN